MNDRQKRLKEVYDDLRLRGRVHTKKDFAEAIGYGRTSISAALNGNELYLTDKLFKKINSYWPEFYNLDYLLTGKGELLYPEEEYPIEACYQQLPEPKASEPEQQPMLPSWANTLIDIMSQQIKENEAL